MLQTKFNKQLEFDLYIVEQKIRKEKGYLTVSERKQLEEMIKNPKSYIIPEQPKKEYKPIIINIDLLRKPCDLVTKEDDIKDIIKELKNTLENVGGIGISANQIGINKRISYIKIPKLTEDKKIEFTELILINTKIIEQSIPIKVRGEGCLSFPGIFIDTKRYIFVIIKNHYEDLKPRTYMSQDYEGFAIQHEVDHQNGIVIFDRRYIDVNHRK